MENVHIDSFVFFKAQHENEPTQTNNRNGNVSNIKSYTSYIRIHDGPNILKIFTFSPVGHSFAFENIFHFIILGGNGEFPTEKLTIFVVS